MCGSVFRKQCKALLIRVICERNEAEQHGCITTNEDRVMNIDKMVFRLAGLFILVSLLLSQLHSVYWLWVTAFVGANLFQASFTGFCPLAMILKKIRIQPGAAF